MTLSCYCGDGDYDWYYSAPEDRDGPAYAPLDTKRSRRCCSCKQRIAVGDLAVRFERFRYAEYPSVEANIYGEGGEVPMPDWFMCERCGDLYYSLTELGFCINLGADSMPALVEEYADMRRAAAIRALGE